MDIAPHQFFQPGLVNGHFAALQAGDFAFINVQGNDFVTQIGECRGGY